MSRRTLLARARRAYAATSPGADRPL